MLRRSHTSSTLLEGFLKEAENTQPVIHGGYLYKLGRNKKWQKRYFAIVGIELRYDKHPEGVLKHGHHVIPISSILKITVGMGHFDFLLDHSENTFILSTTARSYALKGKNEQEVREWVDHLDNIMRPGVPKKPRDLKEVKDSSSAESLSPTDSRGRSRSLVLSPSVFDEPKSAPPSRTALQVNTVYLTGTRSLPASAQPRDGDSSDDDSPNTATDSLTPLEKSRALSTSQSMPSALSVGNSPLLTSPLAAAGKIMNTLVYTDNVYDEELSPIVKKCLFIHRALSLISHWANDPIALKKCILEVSKVMLLMKTDVVETIGEELPDEEDSLMQLFDRLNSSVIELVGSAKRYLELLSQGATTAPDRQEIEALAKVIMSRAEALKELAMEY